jgi:hypothetical protein
MNTKDPVMNTKDSKFQIYRIDKHTIL